MMFVSYTFWMNVVQGWKGVAPLASRAPPAVEQVQTVALVAISIRTKKQFGIFWLVDLIEYWIL